RLRQRVQSRLHGSEPCARARAVSVRVQPMSRTQRTLGSPRRFVMVSPRFALVIALGMFALALPTVSGAEPSTAPPPGTGDEAAGRAGSWIHVDPQTGKRIPGPARAVAIPPNPAFNTSHQGLVEK